MRLFFAEELHAAVRKGVAYTSDGRAEFEIPAGTYFVAAARGTEWSRAEQAIDVSGEELAVGLKLRRELDTAGFVAADTHIHTLTHSGHGDSSVEERLVTLAGEGVELAVATDHNHNTDYRPLQETMGLTEYFTPVVGNEVTTPIGHLNGFPLDPADEIPPHDLRDIVKIVQGIRDHGAKAVILNHPRWPAHDTGPHGVMELDHYSGDWIGSWKTTYDAVELINSQTEEPEPMLLFRDWFALLNRGENVYGVGSSDSHTVGGVVGQGRTYVMSSTDDPSRIDAVECAVNIAEGRSSVSMGIFIDARKDGTSVLGATLSTNGERLPQGLGLRVAAPSWVRARTLTVFANGIPVTTRRLDAEEIEGPMDTQIALEPHLDWPRNDYWLVAVVFGDGVGSTAWPQLNDYTLAATNPVFIDADGDGTYSSPRSQAEAWIAARGTSPEAVDNVLQEVDAAVAVQVMRLVRIAYLAEAERAAEELGRGAEERHPWIGEWFDGLRDSSAEASGEEER